MTSSESSISDSSVYPEHPPQDEEIDFDALDDEDAYKIQIMGYVRQLVSVTPPQSKLAYMICHYMESDFLEFSGLSSVFPETKASYKKQRQKANEAKGIITSELGKAKTEIKKLKTKLRIAPVEEREALQAIVDDNQSAIMELESQLKEHEKISSYKPIYPLKAEDSDGAGVRPQDWEILQNWLVEKTANAENSHALGTVIQNLDVLCSHLGFGEEEKNALLLLTCAEEDGLFLAFIENLSKQKQKNAHAILAKMLGVDRRRISEMFKPDASLAQKGLISPVGSYEDYGSDEDILPSIAMDLLQIMREPDMTLEEMTRRLVGEPTTTHLDWDKDFSHLGDRGNELIRLLMGAMESGKTKGLNVLLYGLQDTGKTEAVKAAAKKVGLELYMVGEKSNQGTEPDRADRISSALLAQAMLSGKKNAAVYFDEMEDLLPAAGGGIFSEPVPDKPTGASKVFLNRMLETNPVITFWTANDPEKFHPAVRRRMRYSIEFGIPPLQVREKLWETISARHDFSLTAGDCHELARGYTAPPGMIDTAVRNAVLTGGGVKTVHSSLKASADLVFGNRRAIEVVDEMPPIYDLRLLNAKVEGTNFNISSLGEQIRDSGYKDFSILLHGPAGTGKSAYLRYLADQLGMEVMLKRASDIFDKYVGESEKRIAKAFRDAEDQERFLVFDEADSVLRNRALAQHSWEGTQVNEMLTWMERAKFPFACTTNLVGEIDPAAKRRFLYKINCDYLTAEAAGCAFELYFGMDPKDFLKKAPPLTPSDFATVKRQTRFIPGEVSPQKIVEMLVLEAQSRIEAKSLYSGTPGKSFGFSPLPK
jgi:transitional endoplasmic reticulum ATPase